METVVATSQDNVTFDKIECEIDIIRKALIDQFITAWYQQMLQNPKSVV